MPIDKFSLACTAIPCCASLDPSDLEAVAKERKVGLKPLNSYVQEVIDQLVILVVVQVPLFQG